MEAIPAECTEDSIEIKIESSIDMEENADDASECNDNEVSKDKTNGDNEEENGQKYDMKARILELSDLPIINGNEFYPRLMKHLTHRLQLKAKRIRPDTFGRNVSYVTFATDEEVNRAVLVLNGYKYFGKLLKAVIGDWKNTPNFLTKIGFLHVPKEFWFLPVEQRLSKALFPLGTKSYEKQLETKNELLEKRCSSFGAKLLLRNSAFSQYTVATNPDPGQMCDIGSMVESPLKEGYCNKCVFSIGKNSGDDAPKLGFRIGNYEKKEVEIAPFDHLKHLSDNVKSVAKAMERYLLVSKYQPLDPFTETGIWHSVAVKTSEEGFGMITVKTCLEDMEEDEIEHLKEELVNFFTNDEESTCKVTSFYIQSVSKIGVWNYSAPELIGGKSYIDQNILGRNFRVALKSFHEGNTGLMEIVYEKVIDMVMEDSNSTVLNIYSDIGVVASKLIEKGRNVICLEPRTLAAEQARENLEDAANLITGESEKTVEEFLKSLPEGESVTVVMFVLGSGADRITIMDHLGKCDKVKRVIYAALMDADISLSKNLNEEGKKKDLLAPVKVIALDSDPYAYEYIGIVDFDRWACQDDATTTFRGLEVKKVSGRIKGKNKGRFRGNLVQKTKISVRNQSRKRKKMIESGRPESKTRKNNDDLRKYISGSKSKPFRDRGGPFRSYGNMDDRGRFGNSWGSGPNFHRNPMMQGPPIPNNFEEGYEHGFRMAMSRRGGFPPRPNTFHSQSDYNSFRRY